MGGRNDDNRLGEYLRTRRDLVTPARAGLLDAGRRRVPGLRREEVAMLAGISPDYYVRLERGRDHHPSVQVLRAIARVLLLDDVETEYLLGLSTAEPRGPRRPGTPHVPDRARHLLAALGVPAFIENSAFDVLASNALARALSPRLRPGENRLRSLVLDPEERRFQQDWETAVADFIALFRRSVADHETDDEVVDLIGELSRASGMFRALWARHDIKAPRSATATVVHPVVGELSLNRDKVPLGDLILVLYYPDEHSSSADKIELLGALSSASELVPGDRAPTEGDADLAG